VVSAKARREHDISSFDVTALKNLGD